MWKSISDDGAPAKFLIGQFITRWRLHGARIKLVVFVRTAKYFFSAAALLASGWISSRQGRIFEIYGSVLDRVELDLCVMAVWYYCCNMSDNISSRLIIMDLIISSYCGGGLLASHNKKLLRATSLSQGERDDLHMNEIARWSEMIRALNVKSWLEHVHIFYFVARQEMT